MAGRPLWILEATHSTRRNNVPAHKLSDTEAVWGRERALQQGQAGRQVPLPLGPHALAGPVVVGVSVRHRCSTDFMGSPSGRITST